ncbi:MAG: BMC domain-containing protein [Clostridium sp.]
MSKSTLGFLETYGFVGAVEGLDVALKSANVELVSCEYVTSGIVTVVITGDVASVKAAIESACVAIEKVGTLRNVHVIARADNEVLKIFNKKEITKDEAYESSQEEEITTTEIEQLEVIKEENIDIKEALEEESEEEKKPIEIEQLMKMTREELELLKVQELRTLARKLKEEHKLSLTKKQIKFSKKDQLVEAILKEQ